ncbi:MAG: O-linked GlcNAc transferase-like protein [Brotaphodocola sp.]
MKKNKGEFGYRDSNRRFRLILVLIFAAAILAQLAARHLTDNPSAKNILTVMAILTVLPMANLASPLLASWKYKTPPISFYEQIHPYEQKCMILYDLIVTTKEEVMPMDAVAVHPNGVFAYCTKAVDTAKAEKAINQIFLNNKLDPNVKILKDEHGFLRRLDSLKPADTYEDDGTAAYAAALMKNLSM